MSDCCRFRELHRVRLAKTTYTMSMKDIISIHSRCCRKSLFTLLEPRNGLVVSLPCYSFAVAVFGFCPLHDFVLT